MPTINQLTSIDTVSDGDQLPIYSQGQGDARKVAASVLAAYVQQAIVSVDDKVTQYVEPLAPTTIEINEEGQSVFLLVTPPNTIASSTIQLPTVASCADRQEVLVFSTEEITALTVDPQDGTIVNAPTTILANGSFRLRYDLVTLTWYRVA